MLLLQKLNPISAFYRPQQMYIIVTIWLTLVKFNQRYLFLYRLRFLYCNRIIFGVYQKQKGLNIGLILEVLYGQVLKMHQQMLKIIMATLHGTKTKILIIMKFTKLLVIQRSVKNNARFRKSRLVKPIFLNLMVNRMVVI
ncbi:hypothetical protein D3C80_1528110 [compost metagenome]